LKKRKARIPRSWFHTVFIFVILSGIFLTSLQLPYDRQSKDDDEIEIVVLGVVQDGGAPHINCNKSYCSKLRREGNRIKVTSLGIIDRSSNTAWIFEASPDFPEQREKILTDDHLSEGELKLGGIFLTHAHIGHYTGLMYLGREAMNAKSTPVYCMPRMSKFLKTNGPWNQLVNLENIEIRTMDEKEVVLLTDDIKVSPFNVPHRDEYSETAGFEIIVYGKKIIFIPDIDKWSKWDTDIKKMVSSSYLAFLDATFFDEGELSNRQMSEIPHPFVKESMELFRGLDSIDRNKVHFIHFNHSNPLLDTNSTAYQVTIENGYRVSHEGMKYTISPPDGK